VRKICPTQLTVINAVINSSGSTWQIEHNCPQCGAPVVLEETDRLFRCPFCRVRLFIWSDEFFRYFIPPAEPAPEQIVFAPYWRLKGIVFSLDGTEISNRILDSNILAMNATPLPQSLGLRPQVLKLRYAMPETPGNFIPPDFPFREIKGNDFVDPLQLARPAPSQISFRYFIGDIASLIFSPIFLRGNQFFDAVLKEPLGGPVSEDFQNRLRAEKHEPSGRIVFLPTLCPGCGWDLDAENDSLVLFCRNCNHAWQASGGILSKVDFLFLPLSDDPAAWLPFWRIRADISGLELKSHGDLLRLANLTGIVHGARPDSELHFWIPAFKSQPNLFLRLARSLTLLGKEPGTGAEPPKFSKVPLYPVNLPIAEAMESIRVLIASIATPKRLVLPHINDLEVSHGADMLAYLPFELQGEEFIQPQLHMSIQKNALRWGRLI